MKDELEFRNLHLLRSIESERLSKWQLQEYTEEQKRQLESLKKEVSNFSRQGICSNLSQQYCYI